MVFEASLLDAGVAVLIVVALASYAKLTKSRGWNWLAVGGVFFLFSGAMLAARTLETFLGVGVWSGIASIFEVIGLIFAVIGTVLVGYETLVTK